MIQIHFKTPTGDEVYFMLTEQTAAAWLGTQGYKISTIELVRYEKISHIDLEEVRSRVKGVYFGPEFLPLKEALQRAIEHSGPGPFMQLAVIFHQAQVLN